MFFLFLCIFQHVSRRRFTGKLKDSFKTMSSSEGRVVTVVEPLAPSDVREWQTLKNFYKTHAH